jgi:antitoxin component YwqK of YwqJK toxin-antitoxin module
VATTKAKLPKIDYPELALLKLNEFRFKILNNKNQTTMAKNYFSILFLMLCLISCNSRQERQLKYDNGNLKESYEVIEQPNGSFFKDGVYKTWYENGQISVSGIYKDNQKSGKWTTYYRTGAVQEEGTYEHNEKSEKWNEYAENGQVLKEYQYSKGSLSGLQQSWYENGQKKVETHYLLGKLDQYYKMWNEDGSVRISCQYKLGKNLSILGKWVENIEFEYKDSSQKLDYSFEVVFDDNGTTYSLKRVEDNKELDHKKRTYVCNFNLDEAQIIIEDDFANKVSQMNNENMTLTSTDPELEKLTGIQKQIEHYKRLQ